MAQATKELYTDYVKKIVPPWLSKPNGAAFLDVMASQLDDLAEQYVSGVKNSWPLECNSDALGYLGAETGLERYPGEIEDDYRVRLWNAVDVWFWAGTETGVLDNLLLATKSWGITDISLRNNADWTPPDSNVTWWSRFWVVIQPPHPWELHRWGVGAWGDGRLWGATITQPELDLMRRVIKKFKASHSYCEAIIIEFDNDGTPYEMSFPVRA